MAVVVLDPERLLKKAASGRKLSTEELRLVVRQLKTFLRNEKTNKPKLSLDDVFTLLVILGKIKARESRNTLELFLEARDPLTVAKALEVLTLEWGETEDYLERVIHFALGTSWDHDDEVRQSALKILGEYLTAVQQDKVILSRKEQRSKQRVNPDLVRQIARLLLKNFEQQDRPYLTRHAAYLALCRAAGLAEEELPAQCRFIDLGPRSRDVMWQVIDQCRTLASKSSSSLAPVVPLSYSRVSRPRLSPGTR